jgi:hypothetical protein
MTKAAVSFAGNLTETLSPLHRWRDRPGGIPGGRVGP